MLYQLFEWLKNAGIKLPGSALFQVHYVQGVAGCPVLAVIQYDLRQRLINYLLKNKWVRRCAIWVWKDSRRTVRLPWVALSSSLDPGADAVAADLNKAYNTADAFSTVWLGFIGL